MRTSPCIVVFDSGLGGLTVFAPIRKACPEARLIYVADEAGFPYGGLSEKDLLARVEAVIAAAINRYAPDLVVIACNTASTLALPHLRACFEVPFVGTVPAIKPAAEQSKNRCFAILATEGTARRDYTRALIEEFASDCKVVIHSPSTLAPRAEAWLKGAALDEAGLLEDIAPCFQEIDGIRTDTVVLGCTHYPLLLEAMKRLAPWPVTWIDPGPAIANRVVNLLEKGAAGMSQSGATGQSAEGASDLFVSTLDNTLTPALQNSLSRYGFKSVGSHHLVLG